MEEATIANADATQDHAPIEDMLPDVLEKILVVLAQPSPIAIDVVPVLRSVCKRWNGILCSLRPAEESECWLVLLFPRPVDCPMQGFARRLPSSELHFSHQRNCKILQGVELPCCDLIRIPEQAGRCIGDGLPVSEPKKCLFEVDHLRKMAVKDLEEDVNNNNMPEMMLDCWVVNPVSGSWYQVALPELLPRKSYLVQSAAGRSGLLAIHIFEACRGARRCPDHNIVSRCKGPHISYWVGNPMTNTWRSVMSPRFEPYPLTLSPKWGAWATSELIVIEPKSKKQEASYKILQLRVFSDISVDREWIKSTWPNMTVSAIIYDSASRSWSEGDWKPQRGAVVSTCICGSCGIVYVLVIDQQMHGDEARGEALRSVGPLRASVLAYNIETERFETVVMACNVVYGGGRLGSPVWQTMQLVVKKAPPGVDFDMVLQILVGITVVEYDALDLQKSWPLESFCSLKFDRAAQEWRVDYTIDMVEPEITHGSSRGKCEAFGVNPRPGTSLYFTAMDSNPDFTMLGIVTRSEEGKALYSPLKFSPAVRYRYKGASTSSATFVPRLDMTP